MGRIGFLGLALVAVSTQTAAAQKKCDPVPQEFLTFGEVHRDCAVDRKAKIRMETRPDYQSLNVSGATACFMVEYDLVVDSAGFVIPASAQLVRTNDRRFADMIKDVLSQLRYEPAKKDGRDVAQLVRYKKEAAVLLRSTASPTGSRRPPPC